MSNPEVKKTRKGKGAVAEVLSWQQKKEVADAEEEAIGKEVEELTHEWTTMVGTMGKEQLEEQVRNRPEHLRSLETPKVAPVKRVRRNRKPKYSPGIMASVWKFHREDDDDE